MEKQYELIKFEDGDFNLDEAQVIISCLQIDNPMKYFFANNVTCEVTN